MTERATGEDAAPQPDPRPGLAWGCLFLTLFLFAGAGIVLASIMVAPYLAEALTMFLEGWTP